MSKQTTIKSVRVFYIGQHGRLCRTARGARTYSAGFVLVNGTLLVGHGGRSDLHTALYDAARLAKNVAKGEIRRDVSTWDPDEKMLYRWISPEIIELGNEDEHECVGTRVA